MSISNCNKRKFILYKTQFKFFSFVNIVVSYTCYVYEHKVVEGHIKKKGLKFVFEGTYVQ